MKKKSIAKNYIYNLIYQMLTIFLPLITTPYLSRILGAEQIGIYGYTCSIVTYFILFGSLGVLMYGQREIAYLQDNKQKRSQLFWEIIIIRTSTMIISGLLFFVIYGLGNQYSLYYKILLIQLFANLFDISWLFQGIEEFDKTVVRNLIVKLLSLVMIFLFVKTKNDLWIYFLIYAGAELIGNLSIWMYVPKYVNRINIKNLELKKHIKPILILFIPQIAIQVYTVLDKTMIGLITKNMEEVGYYEQAQKVVRACLLIISALQIVMNSRIANLHIKNNKNEIKDCLMKSFKFLWFLSIPMMLGLIAIASKFVPWYYGSGFDGVTNILIFTAPILMMIGLNGITGNQYLVQIGKHRIYTFSVIVGALVNVVLNLVLIYNFKGVGASIASVAAEMTILGIQLHHCKDQFKLREIIVLSKNYVVSGIIMLVVLLFIKEYMVASVINTFILLLIGMLIYFMSLIFLKDKFFKDLYYQIILGLKKSYIKKR